MKVQYTKKQNANNQITMIVKDFDIDVNNDGDKIIIDTLSEALHVDGIIDAMAELISSELKTACIDFQENADTVQWTNGYGKAAHVTRLLGVNVDHVLVSYGSVLRERHSLGAQNFTIDDGEVLTLTIERTSEAQDASLTMVFGLVAEET